MLNWIHFQDYNINTYGSFLLVMLHVGVCCAVVSVPCSLVPGGPLGCRVFNVLSLYQMCPGLYQN